jgi:hypothetical protein
MFSKGQLSNPGKLLCSSLVHRKGTQTQVEIY